MFWRILILIELCCIIVFIGGIVILLIQGKSIPWAKMLIVNAITLGCVLVVFILRPIISYILDI